MSNDLDAASDATQTTATDHSDTRDDISALPGVLGTIDLAVARLEAVLLAAGVLLMAANTIANVIGRYLLGSSIFFSEELNRILIILITFAGISYAARHGRHIRMSAIYDALPPKGRRWMMVLIAAVTAICMFALAWYSFGFIKTSAGQGRLLPSLQVPVWWTLVWVPLGFTLTGIQYVLTAYKNVVEDDIYLSTNVLEGYGRDDEREV
ncbi:2,3-diketo-L-gulonate TRAP transporter small permease protein YiaM [Jannaschia seosinensis]|uniref:TRAP transporter small permease protein n=1 Tax=Jannaschia seosinensis TaxID=313367 RepID=A0A0M7B5G1_9RHOB|nr:TRAP transporter small permease [Jannaschia seosinensis]CUH13633.1 2,3-diketo-L-gulonate TRAP transporter small permease protein YiaM [Jannaschia seosinensis]